jgi:hypothetical protein
MGRDWTWNVCLLGSNDTNGALHTTQLTLLGNGGPVSHAFLQQYDETREIRKHYSLLALHRQQLWQTMENTRHIWNCKYGIFKILQPFRTSGNWWSYHSFQGKSSFQNNTFQRSTNVSALKYKNYVNALCTHVTWMCTWGRKNSVRHKTWQLHMLQWKSLQESWGTRSQVVCGQFLFLPWLIWRPDKEKNKLLRD